MGRWQISIKEEIEASLEEKIVEKGIKNKSEDQEANNDFVHRNNNRDENTSKQAEVVIVWAQNNICGLGLSQRWTQIIELYYTIILRLCMQRLNLSVKHQSTIYGSKHEMFLKQTETPSTRMDPSIN